MPNRMLSEEEVMPSPNFVVSAFSFDLTRDGLANWRTRSGRLGSGEERYMST